MEIKLTEQEVVIILGARDKLSYAEMAKSINRSKSWVQILIRGLINKEYLKHERYRHRSIILTDKAKKYLKENGVSCD